jgi:hypothetical protein
MFSRLEANQAWIVATKVYSKRKFARNKSRPRTDADLHTHTHSTFRLLSLPVLYGNLIESTFACPMNRSEMFFVSAIALCLYPFLNTVNC